MSCIRPHASFLLQGLEPCLYSIMPLILQSFHSILLSDLLYLLWFLFKARDRHRRQEASAIVRLLDWT